MTLGRQLGRAAAVGGAGAVWGLSLIRLLAEAVLWSLAYRSPVLVSGSALFCAFAAILSWRWLPRFSDSPNEHVWSSFLPLVLPLPYVLGAVASPLAGGALLAGGTGLAILMLWQDRPRWVLPALLGLVTLGIYLRTLLPSVGEADTFEFQVVVPQLGVAHPTGYPLYVLLGKLFTLLPLRDVAWRLNLASAVFAVGAALVVYDVLGRLTEHPLGSFLVALAFALSPTFWSQAVIAEVYTLHNLLVAAIVWLILPSRERMDGEIERQGSRWKLVFLALGLSLTNHLTTALIVPAVVLAVAWDRPQLRGKDWAVAMGLFAVGLTPYLFIPLRWPALHDGAWMTLSDFLRYVTGGQFHGALQLNGWLDGTRWGIVGRLMVEPFGWAGLVLAAVGVIGWAVYRRRALMITGVIFLAVFAYGLAYQVGDIAVFLIPAHLVLAIWMGVGAALVGRWLSSVLSRLSVAHRESDPRAWQSGLLTLLALVPLSQLWTGLPAVDRHGDQEGYLWGRYALQQPLAESSAVLADPKRFAPLYYLQQVEGVRTDLDMVLLGTEALYQAELRHRLREGQVVYLARYLPHLEDLYLRSVGPLVEVGAADGAAMPELASSQGGEGPIRLLDAEIEKDPLGRRLYHVMLHWQAERAVDGDLVVRMRLVDGDGVVAWIKDGVRPVNGLYPTNAWPPDATISDYHAVPVEPWLAPGTYGLQAGLFPRFADEGSTLDDVSEPWLQLGALNVELPDEPEPLGEGRLIGLGEGAWVTGADVPEESGAGTPLTTELAWRGVGTDERVRLWWSDGEGKGASEGVGGDGFSFTLPAGMVRSRHIITAPREAGLWSLRVALVNGHARCGWLTSPESSCPLAKVQILAERDRLANYGDRVLLLAAEVGRRVTSPGEVIPVSLHWRGLQTMDEDYTVFVHLVGPDGRLHGQVDSWPVQGTYPTSQWRPGREVADPYEVRLAGEAPPGPYRVEVGLYLLETMERLRVLDGSGRAMADSFVVGSFEVER